MSSGSVIFVIVLILVVINAIGKALRQGRQGTTEEEPEEEVYDVPQEEIRKILRQLGAGQGRQTAQQPPPPPRPGGVIPAPPRPTATVGPARDQWPPAMPRPSRPVAPARPPQNAPPTTRRTREDQHLQPTIEKHLDERRLGEGERTLEPTIAQHLDDRRLAADQQSLATSVDAHLTEVGLAETDAMLASEGLTKVTTEFLKQRQVRAAGLRVRRAGGKMVVPTVSTGGIRQAIVLSEILQPPIALRQARM